MGMNTAAVQRLYVAYFNRPADPVSLAVYEAMLPSDTVATQAELLVVAETYFSPSAEYTTNFEGKSNTQIVDQLYQNIFGRSAEADGLISWATKLTDGSITVAELALQLSFSAQGTDATVVNARIDAAVAFTNGLDTAEEITGYSGNAAAAEGRTYLAQISGALPTTDEAITAQKDSAITNVDASIAAAVAAGSSTPGSSYSFTTGTDKLSGTNNDDTYNGVITSDSGTGTTLQAGDQVLASGGTDTLNISVSGKHTSNQSVTAVDAEVEKVLVSNFQIGAFSQTVDTTLMGSLTTVGLSSSSANGDTVFTGLANMVNAEMKNGNADLTVTYNGVQSIAGSADAMTLTVAAQTGGTFTADGIENLTINSSVAKNTVGVASDALGKITVTGAADLVLGAVNFKDNATATAVDGVVDASGATGAVSLTTTTDDVVDFTGGTGNDSLTFAAAIDKNSKVNGGGGDDIVINAAEDTTTMSVLQLTDVETLQLEATDGNALTVNAAGATPDTLRLVENNTDDNNITVNNLDADTVVEIASNFNNQGVGDVVVNLADPSGTGDTANLAVSGTSGQGAEESAKSITLANVETVNLASKTFGATAMLSTDSNVVTAMDVGGTATTLNLSGASNLTFSAAITGAKLTTVDGSAMTGNLSWIAGTADYIAKGGSGNDTFTMGTTLTTADSIDGGGNTGATGVDTLTATINALGTSTTSAVLNVDNVETWTLQPVTAASYLDLSGSAGVTTINVGNANGTAMATLALSGMDGATKIGLGATADTEMKGTIVVNLADESGSDDSVTFVINEGGADDDVNGTLQVGTGSTTLTTGTISTGVEKTVIVVDDDEDNANVTLNVANVATAELEITGGAPLAQDEVLALGTLNAKTTTVTATAFTGLLSVTGSASATNMSVKQGNGNNTITLGAANDTLTLSRLGNDDADGGAGTGDTLNATIATTTQTEATTNFEVINYTIGNNLSTVVTEANGAGIDGAVTFNLLGGNALTTYTHTLHSPAGLTTYNMAGYTGASTDVNLLTGANSLTNLTITGSAGADTVHYEAATGTLALKGMTGVETLVIDAVGATTYDFSTTTTGVTLVKTNDDDTARDVTLTDLTTGTKVEIETGVTGSGVIIDLADKTAADNSVDVKIATVANATHVIDIDAADVETFNLNVAAASTVDLAGLSMTTASATNTLNVTGKKAVTISALHADTTTIDASGMTTGGSVVQTGRSTTAAVEYTGSAGNDTFIMMNSSDVIKAGAGTDTLDINTTAVLGGIVVDLSAADNVSSANGAVNTTEQSGFINVDLAGYAGGYGAVVTANKAGSTIVGTSVVDQFIGGAGGDTMTGGAGNDVMSLGAGTDTLVRNGNGSTDGTDTVSGFTAGTDVIDFTTNGALVAGAAVTGYASGAKGNLLAATGLQVFTDDITTADNSTLTAAELETYLGATAVFQNGATGDSVYLVIDNGANTFVMKITEGADGTDKQFDVADDSFQLIMVLTGVTDATTLTAASFADFT